MGCSKNYIMYWGVYAYYNSTAQPISVNKHEQISKLFLCSLYSFQPHLFLEQRLKLFLTDFFFLDQQCRTAFQHIPVLQDDGFRLVIALVNDTLYFLINGSRHFIAIGTHMAEITADKDLIIITAIVDHANLLRHAVLGHHSTRDLAGMLDILGSTGRHIAEDDLLRDTAAKRYHDILQHPALWY